MSSSNNFIRLNVSASVNINRVAILRRRRNFNRNLRRQGRRVPINNTNVIREMERLPFQQTTNTFANQLFNGGFF